MCLIMTIARKYDGVVNRRDGTENCWFCYRDRKGIVYYRERDGTRRKVSTFTEDWNEANKKLRERLQAKDGNILEFVR